MRAALSTAAVAASAVLLLSGCAADASGDLRRAVADLTGAANGRDADAVRDEVQAVLDALDDAQRSGDVAPAEGAVIRERAMAVLAGADSIDADVIARREAERAAEEAQQRAEAERAAAEEAERRRQEAEQRQQEQEAERAEAERKAAEEAAKEAEKQREEAEEQAEEQREQGGASPTPSPSPLPLP